MSGSPIKMRSKVWQYEGMAGWHFISLPKTNAKKIKTLFGGMSRGWGSIPVVVSLSGVKWKTSIFPDRKSGTYLLPLKAEVRKKLDLSAGDVVEFALEIKI
jgi:hypothetical protein